MKISIQELTPNQIQDRCRSVLDVMGYHLVDEQCNDRHLHAEKRTDQTKSLQLVLSNYNGVPRLGVFSSNVDEKSGIFSHDISGESKFIELFDGSTPKEIDNSFKLTDEDYVLAIG
ncbi:MAG: hypothetical protein IPP51_09080 [Bacteroidetes bacterium]|nr:hypothetical protein [Bacteroidota bacterium]